MISSSGVSAIMLRKGKNLKIELFGVRGSLPTPNLPEFNRGTIESLINQAIAAKAMTPQKVRKFLASRPDYELYGYGGHTSCVEITSQKSQIIIDCGSGLRVLGERSMASRAQKEFHIFLTHFHWDHLIGLPFFTPIFLPGYEFHFYAVQPELEEAIRLKFRKPFFPVAFEELGSKIFFHQIPARKETVVGDISVTPYLLDHPDPCYGLRIESAGKVYSHVVDTECIRNSRAELGPDLPLYQNVDLMLFDAQYTLKEAAEKVHWGHASAIIGLELAIREQIKTIYFVHHDPASSDEHIFRSEREAGEAFESTKKLYKLEGQKIPKVKWGFAREGLVFYL